VGAALTVGAFLGAAVVLGTPGIAAAAPPTASSTPAAPASSAAARTLCQVTDPRLPEISGLVVADDKMLAMNDGGDRLTVYVLDSGCRVVDVRSAPVDPYDPEDLALGHDGTVWFSDTGDNLVQRATVALLAMHPTGSTGVYRLSYPDGPHDAEALLLAPDGTPYIVTKEILGNSGVYRPASALVADGTVPLVRVASLTLHLTGTPGGPVGRDGQLLVTGGAVSRDGRRIALRTYTDAYVWPLTGSDVARALAGTPARIALPEAPQGEAISFGADDGHLVVAGEGVPGAVSVVPVPTTVSAAAASAAAAGTGSAGTATAAHVGVPTVTAGIIAAVVATLAVWISGKVRRRS
jgi:hypothetical protein